MRKVLTTLSIGETYTKHYTLKLIKDVLNITPLDIYIVTDFRNIIEDVYGNNERIFISDTSREDWKLRIPIGPAKIADDFNFNLRYKALEFVQDLEDTFIIFCDCDNSVDWWDENLISNFIDENISRGFDFFGPRVSPRALSSVYNQFKPAAVGFNPETDEPTTDLSFFWHKFFNYDCVDDINPEWLEAPLPSEHMLMFYNNNGKLKRMVDQWKYFFEYLQNRDFCYGTWAEGFEIGISSHIAGFNGMNLDSHPQWGLWSNWMTASGYKNGHKGDVHYETER